MGLDEHGCHPTDEASPEPPPRARVRSIAFLGVVSVLTAVLVLSSLAAYATLGTRPQVVLPPGATVYYNEACGDCAVYLSTELIPALERAGESSVVVKDYIRDRAYRAELVSLNDALGIPFELQSHLATLVAVGGTITAFEGHVPASLIEEALALPEAGRPARVLVYQDSMSVVESYRAWAFRGEPQTYSVSTPLSVYLAWYAANVGPISAPLPPASLLPLVLITGLADGLNPCAFAVLLFFVSFLYAVRAPRGQVLRIGATYAYAVFLVYFLIGLGILGAIIVSDDPHLIAKVAAIAVILLGGFALLRLVFPRLPSTGAVASTTWPRVKARLLDASAPSAAVAGLLVGLCTFPCSGGVYVAILGLLASNTTFLEGLAYLYLYNGMYILPLFAVLVAVTNRRVALAATRWERSNAKRVRAAMAVAMVGLGLAMLVVSL